MADRFWSFDGDTRASHPTAEEAQATCQRALDWYRDDSRDEGWCEDVESIMWGEIRERIVETTSDFGGGEDPVEGVDYLLEPVDPPGPMCRLDGCTAIATHGLGTEAIVCWGHAGTWPEVPRG